MFQNVKLWMSEHMDCVAKLSGKNVPMSVLKWNTDLQYRSDHM